MEAIYLQPVPDSLRKSPSIEAMRRIWIQQFYRGDGQIHWRKQKRRGQPPPNQIVVSPDDEEARYAIKHSTEWVGYKVHFTETCDDEYPCLITHVETTAATTHDANMTESIQDDLITKALQPETQLVDMGYMEVDLLVSSRNKGIELVGPVPSSKSWQNRVEEAFDHTQFDIDWQQRVATCSGGKTNTSCSDRQTRRSTPNLVFHFSSRDCQSCSLPSVPNQPAGR